MKFIAKIANKKAWIECPEIDEWTSGDYNKYITAFSLVELEGDAEALRPIRQLAGVLALIVAGRVTCKIPGVDLKGDVPDLSGIGAKAQGFLIRCVAWPLEGTQVIPFERCNESKTGTTETET